MSNSVEPHRAAPSAGRAVFVAPVWALVAVACAWTWLSHALHDGFSAALTAGFAAWALITALWLGRARQSAARRGRRAYFPWTAAQVVAVVIVTILAVANGIAAARERQRAAWDAATPDYASAFETKHAFAPSLPGLGGRLLPNLKLDVKTSQPGRTVRFTTNSIGARSLVPTEIPKPADTFRIVLVGDSFTVGYRVGDEEVFGAQLERILNERLAAGTLHLDATRIEVVRLCTEAPPPTWYWFDQYASQLEPDLVIDCFCLANDFSQSLFMLGEPPIPPYAEWTLGDSGAPAPNTYADLLKWEDPFTKWLWSDANRYPAAALTDPPITADQLAARRGERCSPWALGRALQAARASVAGAAYADGFTFAPQATDTVFAHGETGLFLRETHPAFAVAGRTVTRSLEAFASWSEKNHVPVALALIPVRYQVVSQDREATFSAPGLRPEAFDLQRPNRLLEGEAARLHLRFFDWTPVFAAKGDEAWREFMPRGDIHWNEKGHRTAAEALAPEVIKWIEASE